VDHWAARGVDQIRRGLHEPERALVDVVVRLGQERYVERDEVRLTEESVALAVDDAQVALGLEVADGIVVEHAHGEALGAPGDGPADPAEPENAERLSVDVATQEQHQAPLRELAGPREGVRLGDPAGGRQEEGPGEVGRGLGQDPGGVGDDDAPPAGGGDVDVVVPDGHVRDDPKPRGVGEQGLVDRVGQEAHESVGVAELGGELRRREPSVLWVQADGRLAPGERERRLREVP
jgi:hypothetical protein